MTVKQKGLEGLEELRNDALRKGLERADANMVRVATDIIEQSNVDDTLSNITIEIVPYEIPDTSLRQIVLNAPETVIKEITDALAERRHRAEFGDEDGN